MGAILEVEVTLQLTVSQSVCFGVEHSCGTCDQVLLPVGMLSEICGLLSVGRWALGSLYVVPYDSQGYVGGILTRPLPWGTGLRIYILQEQDCRVQSRKSKSRYDRWPVNRYVLVPSPLSTKGLHPKETSIRHQEVYIKATFFMLPLGGLRVKHAVQLGIWVPTQHVLWDQGKPWSSWPVAGPSGCKLTSGIEYANPNTGPYLCFLFSFSLKTFTSCSSC
jgi:hypothetical protein